MKVASSYLHSLNGRLRIKIAEVKNSPAEAMKLESQLSGLDGIKHLKANPTTGNVLIFYDHERIGQGEIIDAMRAMGYLKPCGKAREVTGNIPSARQACAEALTQKIIESLAQTMVQTALQSLISALI